MASKAVQPVTGKEYQVFKEKGKAHRGAPRRKKSWRTKDDKFCERTNAELDVVLDQLSKGLHVRQLTVQLPITTRAFGTLASTAYRFACDHLRQPPILSLNAFYRLSLAQLHLQLIKASYQREGQMSNQKIETQDIQVPYFNFDSLVMSHPATLIALATVINTIGVIEHHSTKYYPIIPKSGVTVLSRGDEPARKDQCTDASSSSTMQVDNSKPPQSTTIRAPDPFTVTFSRLREDVVYLSNPKNSPDARKFFRRHNPIPGAIWNADNVLQNANDIMPPDYGLENLRMEFQELDSFVDRLNGKNAYFLGSCNYSGKGEISQLTNTVINGRVYCDSAALVDTEFCGSPFDIGNRQMILGLLSQVGEFPPYPTFNPAFSIRSSTICGRKIVRPDWNAVVDFLL